MANKEYVDWNEYRILANRLRNAGLTREAKMVRGLIRVGVSVDRGGFTEAVAHLTKLPHKTILGA